MKNENHIPINKTAALVTSKTPKAAQFTPKPESHKEAFQNQFTRWLKMKQAANQLNGAPPENVKDWRGAKVGRFTPLGYAFRQPQNGKHFWIARCDCGTLEIVSAKTLGAARANHACRFCDELASIQYHAENGGGDRQLYKSIKARTLDDGTGYATVEVSPGLFRCECAETQKKAKAKLVKYLKESGR